MFFCVKILVLFRCSKYSCFFTEKKRKILTFSKACFFEKYLKIILSLENQGFITF